MAEHSMDHETPSQHLREAIDLIDHVIGRFGTAVASVERHTSVAESPLRYSSTVTIRFRGPLEKGEA